MGALLAAELIERASILSNDLSYTRWSKSEWCNWLDDAQRAAFNLNPSVNVITTPIQLVPGVLQNLPDGGVHLKDITRNLGSDGQTNGNAISVVDRYFLDAFNPDWYSETADCNVKHFMFDIRNSSIFYVYPSQPSPANYVEAVYTSLPTKIVRIGGGGSDSNDPALDSTINIQDEYWNALIDYILYRAYSKDTDIQSTQKAIAYYQSFVVSVTSKIAIDTALDPNKPNPVSPTYVGN